MRIASWTAALAAAAVIVMSGWTFGAAEAPKAGNWPCFQGAGRDSTTTETVAGDPETFKPAWKASVGAGYSSVAVVDGRAYTMGNTADKDAVFCFDANGVQVWKSEYACGSAAKNYPGPRCTPAVDGGLVYSLSREGHFRCVDANTGDLKWSKEMAKDFSAKPPQWGFACSPVIVDEWVIIDVGTVVAFKKATGEKVWASAAYAPGYSTPRAFELKGKKMLAVFNGFGLVLLNQADGKELAKHPWKTNYDVNAASPVIIDDKIFISSGYGTGCALLEVADKGLDLKWQNKNMSNHYATCVYDNGFIYGIDGGAGGKGKLVCLDAATGAAKWSQAGLGTGALTRIGDKLLVQGETGDLGVFEIKSDAPKAVGKPLKVLTGTCWTQPVLVGGKILCRNDKGDLVCLDAGGK